ncbi:MAG: vWA domain-containing protein [Oscillochloridaceae bacterium umkhey_bin13]
MHNLPDNLSHDELYALMLQAYHEERWADALTALERLLSEGGDTTGLQGLYDDLSLKQRLVPNTAPIALPQPRSGRARLLLGALLALSLAALVGLGLRNQVQPGVELIVTTSTATIVGSLPTPAPNTMPEPTSAALNPGVLVVNSLPSEQLTVSVNQVYLILDASGSMLARIGEERKITMAHTALERLVTDLPAGVQVALRTYGRQRPDDCSDIELVTPLGPLDRDALRAQIRAITPVNLGRTPMAATLDAIQAELAEVSGSTLVVLVSDGDETCDGDPVAAAARLRSIHPEARISVIGFDVEPAWRERLAGIALAGAGNYVDAANAEELANALEQVVAGPANFEVLSSDGQVIIRGSVGEQLSLPPGRYALRLPGQTTSSEPVTVRAGLVTLVDLQPVGDLLEATARITWAP